MEEEVQTVIDLTETDIHVPGALGRKESNMPMSSVVFEKHNFQKQQKRKMAPTEDFDPRPLDCRGNVKTLLPALLESVRNESLGISLLLDPKCCHSVVNDPVGCPSVPETAELKTTILAFKKVSIFHLTNNVKLNKILGTNGTQICGFLLVEALQ